MCRFTALRAIAKISWALGPGSLNRSSVRARPSGRADDNSIQKFSVVALLIFFSCAPQPATAAGPFVYCLNLFSRLIYGYQPPSPLSPVEKQRWQEWLAPQSDFPSLHHTRLDEPTFWHIYSKIPFEIQERLQQMPSSLKAQRRYLDDLARQLGHDFIPSSFIDVILRKYSDRHWSQPKLFFREWTATGLKKRQQQLDHDPQLSILAERHYQQQLEEYRANKYWDDAFVVPLKYETEKGGGLRVTLDKITLDGYETNGWAYLKVPTRLMKHPAWNPMSETQLMAMAEQGVAPPPFYDALLGHDGQFYIQDGNHRFALNAKEVVWVRLKFPPQTTPLRNYLDHYGIAQPDGNKILQLYRGEITFEDLLPAHVFKRLILKP